MSTLAFEDLVTTLTYTFSSSQPMQLAYVRPGLIKTGSPAGSL